MAKSKILFEGNSKCPYCGNPITVKALRETIEEPIKGEYENRLLIWKNTQTQLGKP